MLHYWKWEHIGHANEHSVYVSHILQSEAVCCSVSYLGAHSTRRTMIHLTVAIEEGGLWNLISRFGRSFWASKFGSVHPFFKKSIFQEQRDGPIA